MVRLFQFSTFLKLTSPSNEIFLYQCSTFESWIGKIASENQGLFEIVNSETVAVVVFGPKKIRVDHHPKKPSTVVCSSFLNGGLYFDID